MNGMLGRASGNPPSLLNVQILQSRAAPVQGQTTHSGGSSSKPRQRERSIECHQHHQTEPNSVLDIRSPSSSSARSSSLGGSSESGAAAGPLCEAVSDGHGRLPDPDVNHTNGAWRSDEDGVRRLRLQPQKPPSLSPENERSGEGSTREPNNNNGERSGMIAQGGYEAASAAEERTRRGTPADERVAVAQASAGNARDEFQTMGDKFGGEDLESMLLLESASPAPDQSLMRCLLGEMEDPFQHRDPSSSAQIKTGSWDAMDSHFSAGFSTDTAALFPFPASPGDAVGPVTPSMSPGLLSNPGRFSHSQCLASGSGLENGSWGFVPNVPCFQPEPGCPPAGVFDSNACQMASNPFRMPADVAAAAAPPLPPPSSQNNVFFPVSYAQQLQTRPNVVVVAPPPPAKRQRSMPELLQKPLPWQQQHQGSHLGWKAFVRGGGGGLRADPAPVVNAEQPDMLVLLPRRLPQFQRQRAIFSNNNEGSDEVQFTMVQQLIKAAEAVEIGNLGLAQAILARLNQHLSPLGKPLHRAAFYFKEALSYRLLTDTKNKCTNNDDNHGDASALPPLDIVHKIGAYKSFSEVSPLSQFANFTANQALLESLKGAEAIHIIDFEIGLGGQWASFLQEIAVPVGGSPAVRLSALGSGDSMEMHLTRENLCHFAKDLNIAFEFNVVEVEQLECLTPAMLQLREREAVAVNFSLGMHRLLSSFSSTQSITSLLTLLKQLSPKAIVVVDNESEQNGVSFAQQFLEALQFYSFLFDSLDATSTNLDIVHSIEKFLLAPKIGDVVAAKCHSAPAKRTPPWRSLFIDAGLSPMAFSDFTEVQAEYLITRLRGRGFEVIKTHGSLLLVWQGRALVAASAWRC